MRISSEQVGIIPRKGAQRGDGLRHPVLRYVLTAAARIAAEREVVQMMEGSLFFVGLLLGLVAGFCLVISKNEAVYSFVVSVGRWLLGLMKHSDNISDAVESLTDNEKRILEMLKHERELRQDFERRFYAAFPGLVEIEQVCDSEEEQEELTRQYLNLNDAVIDF